MKKIAQKGPKLQPKNKLTKEDLLAGKWIPDRENRPSPPSPSEDPRFKSPDSVLGPRRSQNGHEADGENLKILTGSQQYLAPKTTESTYLMETIRFMKFRHDKEIIKWKLYEEQVNIWKERVLRIVQQLKAGAIKAEEYTNEVSNLKEKMKNQDEEISKLKKQGHSKSHRKKS